MVRWAQLTLLLTGEEKSMLEFVRIWLHVQAAAAGVFAEPWPV